MIHAPKWIAIDFISQTGRSANQTEDEPEDEPENEPDSGPQPDLEGSAEQNLDDEADSGLQPDLEQEPVSEPEPVLTKPEPKPVVKPQQRVSFSPKGKSVSK